MRLRIGTLALALTMVPLTGLQAQQQFTIEQVLSPGYPFELASADNAERIAWISYERGMRNVYTAEGPDFVPVRLTHNDADDGNDLSSLRISDDGSVVVFVRGHAPNRDGWVANPTSDPRGSERAIWAVRTLGGNPWRVVEGSNPVLSPDGRWVLYTKDGQIYRMPVDPFEIRARAGVPEEPLFLAWGRNGSPRWSPDSRKIAFVSSRGDHSYIGVYDTEDPRVSYLAAGVDRDSSPTWSPDGSRIAFVRRPGSPFGSQATGGTGGGQRFTQFQRQTAGREIDGLRRSAFPGGYTLSLQVADVKSGLGEEFWHAAPDDTVFTAIRSIQWAGEHVVFSVEQNNWRHWYSLEISGKKDAEPRDLTPGEGLAESVSLSKDGEWLYYATNVDDIDRRHVWRTRTRGGRTRQLTEGDEIETYPAVLASGEGVAMLTASASRPLSVAVVRARGGEPRVIFPRLNSGFPLNHQVVPENVILTAEDGMQFHNQLFLPGDLKPGERRPAILFTHGGPQRQMLLGYHYRHFYHMAYAINQYLANQGYVVISVNYRSGIGYGRAFRNPPERGSRGNSEYRDVLAAGRYLQNHPNVDPNRIGLWGLSYGGLITAQGLARNSDIFCAGVDLAGVHLWGSSIAEESVSYQSSPIAEVKNWTSPVLLIHGDDDRNVAFSQTTGLVQLLRANNIYHELIVFPDDVHDSLLYSRWLLSFNAMDDFFTRFVKNRK
jgi:dipeptidyl aminopeptidase/acylaminoacyl peptidase